MTAIDNAPELSPASRMVERGARALCLSQGSDPETWPTFIPIVATVLEATMLPRIPVAQGEDPASHPDLNAWAEYRKTFGEAGAYAREPDLRKATGWHVLAAWRTWNGMVNAALDSSEETSTHSPDERLRVTRAVGVHRPPTILTRSLIRLLRRKDAQDYGRDPGSRPSTITARSPVPPLRSNVGQVR